MCLELLELNVSKRRASHAKIHEHRKNAAFYSIHRSHRGGKMKRRQGRHVCAKASV